MVGSGEAPEAGLGLVGAMGLVTAGVVVVLAAREGDAKGQGDQSASHGDLLGQEMFEDQARILAEGPAGRHVRGRTGLRRPAPFEGARPGPG